MALRPAQERLLAAHEEAARDVLLSAFASFEPKERFGRSAAGQALLCSSPEVLVSVAVCQLAAFVERMRAGVESSERVWRLEAVDVFPAAVLDVLRRRKLPYEPADAELALDIALSFRWHDRLPFAVVACEQALVSRPGDPTLVAALTRAAATLDEDPGTGHAYADTRADARRRIRALLARQVPGGLLDLSVLEDGDLWVEQARAVLRAHAETTEGVQDLLALLAAARGSRPSQAWLRRAQTALERGPALGGLLRDLLEPVVRIDLVPTPDGIAWPPSWLLAPANETIAKGATWGLRLVAEDWVVPLLGGLALRCSASSPDQHVTTALSAPVGNAAIDSLAALDGEPARAELRRLVEEVRRRDVVKRIAAALGEDASETQARDEKLRMQKRRSLESSRDRSSRLLREDATAIARAELVKLLSRHGFGERRGPSLWRQRDDRVEHVRLGPAEEGLLIETGIAFEAVPRPDAAARPRAYACDIEARMTVDVPHASAELVGTLPAVVSLLGDWFARFERVEDVVAMLAAAEDSSIEGLETRLGGAPGSANRALVLGYLAASTGDRVRATRCLAEALAGFRERAVAGGSVSLDLQAWAARIEADLERLAP